MLGDDKAVRSVVDDILGAHPAKGTVIAECSTVYPGLIEELERRAEEEGCHLLACPVFGRPDAVKAGNALFVCAGDPSAKQKVHCHGFIPSTQAAWVNSAGRTWCSTSGLRLSAGLGALDLRWSRNVFS